MEVSGSADKTDVSQTPKPGKKPRPRDSPLLDGDESVSEVADPMVTLMSEMRVMREEIRLSRKESAENRDFVTEELKRNREFVTEELKKMDSKIQKSLTEATDKLKSEVVKLVKEELKKDFKKQDGRIDAVFKKIDKQTADITKAQEVVENFNSDIEKQNDQLKRLQKQLIDKDARERQKNLLFFGVQENHQEDLKKCVSSFIKKELKLDKDFSFESCRRIGAPRKPNHIGSKTNSPRPILVQFTDKSDKETVKKESKNLKPPFGCSLDLPQEVRRARQSLSSAFKSFQDDKKDVAMLYPARIVDMSTYKTLKEADIADFLSPEK